MLLPHSSVFLTLPIQFPPLSCRYSCFYIHAKMRQTDRNRVFHEFRTGAWILDAAAYREFEAEHRRNYQLLGVEIGDPDFFPIYRYQPQTV